MDYVVFGLGFGASLLVLGLVIRDVGPRVRYRQPGDPDGVFHAEELVARVSWERFCGALGTIMAVAGLLFVIVTAICMLARTSDRTAGWVMIGAVALLCVLMAVWTWAFFDRFGAYGILPERGEQRSTPEGADQHQATDQLASTVSDPAVSNHPPADQSTDPATQPGSERAVPDEVEDESSEASADDTEVATRKTPEELVADANDVDHESLDQEVDIPVDAPDRPRRHGLPAETSTSDDAGTNDDGDAGNRGDSPNTMSSNRDPAT